MAEFLLARPVRREKAAVLSPRHQSYANQSLAELTEKLVKCSREEKSQTLSSRTRDIVYVLKVHKLRHPSNAHAFLEARGVDGLLSLLSLCAEREGRDRGLLLGTLANICALHRDCRSKVMSHGLTQVASVLAHCQTPATLSSLARLLANLSLDSANIPQLQEVGVVRELSHALLFQTASDTGSKLSVLRAIRLLSSSEKCREDLKASEGLPGLVDCLKSHEVTVAESALRTLHLLLLDSDPDIVLALVANRGIPPVVQLCCHGDQTVGDRALEVLVVCAGLSEGRPGLHSAGGVECLLAQLERLGAGDRLFSPVVTALCASCRDVVGRQRMRDCGGLEQLIQLLSSPEQGSLHPDILSALVCYYFDEHSLKFMVRRLGLLKALTYQLQQMSCHTTTTNSPEAQPEPQPIRQGPEGEGEGEGETMLDQKQEPQTELEQRPESELNRDSEGERATGSSDSSGSLSPSVSGLSPSLTGFDSATSQATSSPHSPQLQSASSPRGLPSPTTSSPQYASSSPPLSSSPSPSPSACQPPAKKPRLSCDMEFAHPPPANFLDSLLCSPSPYQSSRRPDVTATPETTDSSTSRDSHVVQLLSRVSHMRDCLAHLASRDLLLAMLDCLFSSPSFLATHIFKTLSRVFASPHCFQVAVSCLIPSRLHRQLCLTPSLSPPTLSFSSDPPLDLPSPVPSLSSPHHLPPSPTPTSPTPGLAHMCGELLGRLSRVGQSPYGQGVLAHLLLTGDERDKTAAALATPLLCRAPRVCRRLMVDYKAQELLLQLLTHTSSYLREAAADSILALGSSVTDLRPTHDMVATSLSSHLTDSYLSCLHSGVSCKERCCYRDYDHYPFDYVMKLDRHGTGAEQSGSGTGQIELPTHRDVLMEASDMFAVMLGGHFLESGRAEVYLRDVHPQAFLSLLHHVYGCGWQCRDALTTSGEGSHDVSHDLNHTSSNSLIAAVLSNADLPSQQAGELMHTLHCLETASRFLLDPMRESCERHASYFISTATVVPLFLFAQLHSCDWLARECVRCLLSLPPSPLSQACLLELASCPEATAALSLLQSLMSTRLHTTP